MARSKDVLLRFLVDDKQKSKLAGIGNEAGKTQSKFSQLSGGAKAVVGGMAAIVGTKIVAFLGDATKAALEDNAAQVQLAVALKNTVGATDAQIASAEDWIDTTTRATGITDNELRPALANLVRATGDVEEAQTLMGTAMDIATARGLPLEAVSLALTKAANGNVGAMGRLGLKVRDSSGAFLTFEQAVAEANHTMGGATTAAAESAEGKFRRMTVAIDEAKESIGNALLPVLSDLAQQGTDALKVMGFLGEEIGDLIPEAGGVGTELTKWLGPLAVSREGFHWLAGEIDKATAAAKDAENPFQGFIDDMDDVSGSTDDATESLEDFEDEVRSQTDPIFNLTDKLDALKTAQANTTSVVAEYGENSPQHLKALRDEAKAWMDYKEALLKAGLESGDTRETYETNLKAMGIFTQSEIDLMMADFDRLDGRQVDVTIQVNRRGDITNRDRGGDTRRARGGSVMAGQSYTVGEMGTETFVPSTNGTIVPHGAGGATYNIGPVYASGQVQGQQAGKAIVEEIRQYEKRNGRGWRS